MKTVAKGKDFTLTTVVNSEKLRFSSVDRRLLEKCVLQETGSIIHIIIIIHLLTYNSLVGRYEETISLEPIISFFILMNEINY